MELTPTSIPELAEMSFQDYKTARAQAPTEADAKPAQNEKQPEPEAVPDKDKAADKETPEPGAVETTDKKHEDDEEVDESKLPVGVQKAINKKTFQMRTAQRERDEALARLKQMEEAVTNPPPPAVDLSKKPQLADFDYDEAQYERALEAHVKAKTEAEATQRTEAESAVKHAAELQTKIANAEKEKPDFRAVAFDPAVLATISKSPALQLAISVSDNFGKLAYHLGKNPEVLESLVAMPQIQAVFALGKLEASLMSPPPKPVTPPLPTPSKPVGGRNQGYTEPTRAELAEMPLSEYKLHRARQK